MIESPLTAAAPSTDLPVQRPWKGRVFEAFAIGGATVVLFPLAWLLRSKLGKEPALDVVDFGAYYLSFVINNPHFTVTYLLFYKGFWGKVANRDLPNSLRARYVFAGVIAPLFLAAWAAGALVRSSGQTLGYLIELMFLLVGWHYVKQGFGILTVLSLRRGFRLSLWERRAVLFHCFSAWAFAWSNPSGPSKLQFEKGVFYFSIMGPPLLEKATAVVLALSTLTALGMFVRRSIRDKALPPLSPLLSFFITLWLWTIFSSLDPVMMYLIPALHSLQYLYVVGLYKRNQARSLEGPPHFGKPALQKVTVLVLAATALAWFLFYALPKALDSTFPSVQGSLLDTVTLGKTPFFAAIFVFINLHHYFMDNVIWRRDNPETRYLFHVS
ncbi:MAG: hypothetical protein IPK82_30720 [Polyangiaceae bacterium]|nr:hypothetical protein [Polyangiaceae bacterium]